MSDKLMAQMEAELEQGVEGEGLSRATCKRLLAGIRRGEIYDAHTPADSASWRKHLERVAHVGAAAHEAAARIDATGARL
jgi:hypothetical protein